MISGLLKTIQKKFSSDTNSTQDIIIETIKTPNGQQIQKKYIKHKKLGAGAFAQCYQTQNIETKKLYATKIIAKDSRTRMKLLNQLVIHQLLHHQNIVDFSHAFEDQQFIYVFMQLCQNKTLQDLLNQQKTLSNSQIRRLISQIIEGVKYIHSKNLLHRDLKPRNIFLAQNNTVKIGDFGLACKLQFEEDRKRSLCGTPQYMPPQVIQGRSYGKQVDVWAIGVLLYEMYTHKTPFVDKTAEKIMENICSFEYQFPEKGIPKDALALIKRILIKNPQLRPTLQEILQSPFMNDMNESNLSSCPSSRYNSFNLNFEENSYHNQSLSRNSSRLLRIKSYQKVQQAPYIVQVQKVGTQIILYRMSNQSIGIFHKNKQIFHEGQSKINLLIQESLFDGKKLINNENQGDPMLKKLLKNFKSRKNLKEKVRVTTEGGQVYLSKFSIHRNILILRLSNNYLQLLFEDNTTILINLSKMQNNIKYIDEQNKSIQINMHQITENMVLLEKILQRQKIQYLMRIYKSIMRDCHELEYKNLPKNQNQSMKCDKTIC